MILIILGLIIGIIINLYFIDKRLNLIHRDIEKIKSLLLSLKDD